MERKPHGNRKNACNSITWIEHTTNGIKRDFRCKKFGNELRIYKVLGDITDRDQLAEAAQELAILTGAEKVVMSL